MDIKKSKSVGIFTIITIIYHITVTGLLAPFSTNQSNQWMRELYRFFRDSNNIEFILTAPRDPSGLENQFLDRLWIKLNQSSLTYVYSETFKPIHLNEEVVELPDIEFMANMFEHLTNYEKAQLHFYRNLFSFSNALYNFDLDIVPREITFNQSYLIGLEEPTESNGIKITIDFKGDRYILRLDDSNQLTIERPGIREFYIPDETLARFSNYANFVKDYHIINDELTRFYAEINNLGEYFSELNSSETLALR